MCNKENFFKASIGAFTEIPQIPQRFTSFFKNKSSEYLTNEDETKLIRISDHWGSGIRFCNWYIKGRKNNNCELFQKWNGNCGVLIGVIGFKDFINVEEVWS